MKKLICTVLVMALVAALWIAVAEGIQVDRFDFTTTDLEGNEMTSEALYAQNKITMVNLWATWCGPCVGELGELAELHTQLQEMGCGVVGVMLDSTTDEGMQAAPKLMEENGTNYPVVAYSADMDALLEGVSGIPTSFFVDSTGAIVGEPIVGAYPDRYLPAVQALLETN